MQILGAAGTAFRPTRFVLGERLSVVNFARALDVTDPVFLDVTHARAHGYAGRPVPPAMYAFFQTVSNDDLEERLGFHWGRTLGAGMEFTAGVIAGEEDEVVGQSSVEAAWEAAGRSGATRQFLRLRTDFRRADGELVCRWRALFIERKDGPPDPDAPSEATPPESDEALATPVDLWAAPSATVGQALPEHRIGPIDRLRLARISIAIDNPDPVHVDDAVAQASGFPTVIGQGSGATGLLYEPVRLWAGMARVRSGAVRLAAPYSLGAELCAQGEVTAIHDVEGERQARCDVRLTDQAGAEIATAQFQVRL
jgi:acyl dehydratase